MSLQQESNETRMIKILLVEDRSDRIILIQKHLQQHPSYILTIAKTITAYKSCIRSTNFDVILFDMNLVDDFHQKIGSPLNFEESGMIFVLLTDKKHEKGAVEALNQGVFDYFVLEDETLFKLSNTIQNAFEFAQIKQKNKKYDIKLSEHNHRSKLLGEIIRAGVLSKSVDEFLTKTQKLIPKILFSRHGCFFMPDVKKQKFRNVYAWGKFSNTHFNEIELKTIKLSSNGSAAIGALSDFKFDFPVINELFPQNESEIQCVFLKDNRRITGFFLTHRPYYKSQENQFLQIATRLITLILNRFTIRKENLEFEEFKTKVMSGIQEGAVIADFSGTIEFANQRFALMVDVKPETLIGKSIKDFIHSDDQENYFKNYPALKNGTIFNFRTQLNKKNGNAIPVIMNAVNYSETEVLSFYTDLSEYNALEQKYLQTQKLSSLGQFISVIAHELNNPLAGIIGYAEILKSRNDTKSVSHEIEIIHREAVRSQHIVNQLLEFTRKQKSTSIPVNINAILIHVLEMLEVKCRVENIEIKRELAPDLPLAQADKYQIQQVFHNILANARQAIVSTERLGIIQVSTASKDKKIFIKISDNGPGIPEKLHKKIFDPFFTTKEPGRGTGLGLSICNEIVNSLNGKLEVSSVENEGTTFTIVLPVAKHQKTPEKIPLQKIEEPVDLQINNEKVLVVDDEDVIASLLVRILENEGFNVDVAHNGFTALEKVKGEHYTFIISDIRMPKMDGKAFYQRICNINPTLARKIVFTTGDSISQELKQFFQKAKNPILNKPFTVNDIKNIVNRLMSSSEKAESIEES